MPSGVPMSFIPGLLRTIRLSSRSVGLQHKMMLSWQMKLVSLPWSTINEIGPPADDKKISEEFFGDFDLLPGIFQQAAEMDFCVIQQVDHHLSDVTVQIVILKRGERQEARTRYHMDTTGSAA